MMTWKQGKFWLVTLLITIKLTLRIKALNIVLYTMSWAKKKYLLFIVEQGKMHT